MPRGLKEEVLEVGDVIWCMWHWGGGEIRHVSAKWTPGEAPPELSDAPAKCREWLGAAVKLQVDDKGRGFREWDNRVKEVGDEEK